MLLTPTRIYARPILALRSALLAAGHDLRGIAHVTGGGLPGNVPRALPDGPRVRGSTRPAGGCRRSCGWSAALGGLADDEVRATFNGGPRDGRRRRTRPRSTRRSDSLRASGVEAALVGEVVTVDRLDGARYAEGALA